jgi:hypothetical protein
LKSRAYPKAGGRYEREGRTEKDQRKIENKSKYWPIMGGGNHVFLGGFFLDGRNMVFTSKYRSSRYIAVKI